MAGEKTSGPLSLSLVPSKLSYHIPGVLSCLGPPYTVEVVAGELHCPLWRCSEQLVVEAATRISVPY